MKTLFAEIIALTNHHKRLNVILYFTLKIQLAQDLKKISGSNEHKFKTICIFAAEIFLQEQEYHYNTNSIILITKTIQI